MTSQPFVAQEGVNVVARMKNAKLESFQPSPCPGGLLLHVSRLIFRLPGCFSRASGLRRHLVSGIYSGSRVDPSEVLGEPL